MKLTKSQRLFIKAGEQQAFMKIYSNRGHFKAAHRKLRKQLIREALEAYETEILSEQASAYERGFCAGRRINNTTKTQHT